MPGIPIESTNPDLYPGEMETRVALLERIARSTIASLERIERRLDMQAAARRSDFRWLLGVILAGFATMFGA